MDSLTLYPDWISVKDRLPEPEECYLVNVRCTDGDAVTVMYFSADGGFPNIGITHWMPLPNPPEVNDE